MIKEIQEKIDQFQTIIIHRHERPDPDALGSQLGLASVIQERYPTKKVYVVGEEEPSLFFLGTMNNVNDEEYKQALVIVCDTANTARVDDKRFDQGSFLIKIDHHPNEEPYGDLNWVNTNYSSTSEMIVHFVENSEAEGYTLNSKSALLLYAGIVGDTGRFRYTNTTPETLQRASLLVKQTFDQNAFYSNLHKKDVKMTRLQGYVLQHFSIIEGKVGVMRLTKDVLQTFNVTSSESSQLVNSFSDVEGLKVWVFFVEEDEKIRVRLRSKGPIINTIATEHNGGGHPMAAGATAYSWEETEEIVKKLIEVCK
ncbi:bifunctional oligoribonuclease/PAP phosphatase NrnA [Alkalihalobacillus sp. MEB130]|uniref:DHH family phosphoesterase n=1 Tax=Alkalihalobacillus sp. MEB130 TaxID=2976704 RepID=UPI0028DE8852|nr:bifunctional oligoribonuclease/PAP phosphatase NrnA [Alkalihalobacillus sp. MEB130]MDT8859406.1 bifunctional oligoribonuclease/PAP phosphatase NrnA [Alkalihalobacillus sp. MEB130]